MLRIVARQRGPAIKCFTVLKKVHPDGSMSLRLVFDLRGTNCEFCPAPFCNLANAANFAYVDLSSDVLSDDSQLVAWQGDIPNFVYKLEIPEGLSEFFCLEGVSARELGLETTVGNKLAIKVVSMGWSWAPYLAQTAAEDVLSSVPEIISDRENDDDDVSSDIGIDEDVRVSEISETCEAPVKRDYRLLKHMQVTPQFFDEKGEPAPFRLGVSYVYIDDFGGWAILPKVDDASLSLRDAYPEAEKDLSAARARLTKAGLGCHKEVIGLPNALGYEVAQKNAIFAKCFQQTYICKRTFSVRESLHA